jgi:hypothetical protein
VIFLPWTSQYHYVFILHTAPSPLSIPHEKFAHQKIVTALSHVVHSKQPGRVSPAHGHCCSRRDDRGLAVDLLAICRIVFRSGSVLRSENTKA